MSAFNKNQKMTENEAIGYAQKVFSIKYETLKNIKDLNHKTKESTIWNIVLDIADFYSVVNKKTDTQDINDVVNASYSIMNILAHYRHYMSRYLNLNTRLFLYNSSERSYYEIEKMLNTICDMVDDVYFISERIDDKSSFLSTYYALVILNENDSRKNRILNLSHNKISSQFLRIDKEMLNIDYKRGLTNGLEYFFDSFFNQQIQNKQISLIPLYISIFGLGVFKHIQLSSSFAKVTDRIYKNGLELGMGSCTHIDKLDQILEGTGIGENYKETIRDRLKEIDVNNNSDIYPFMKKILLAKKKKIKSNSVFNVNNEMENKDGFSLNINWLMEK